MISFAQRRREAQRISTREGAKTRRVIALAAKPLSSILRVENQIACGAYAILFAPLRLCERLLLHLRVSASLRETNSQSAA